LIKDLNIKYFYIIALTFILINSISIGLEFYYVPIISFILLFSYIAFFHLNTLLYLIVFLVPMSINLNSNDIKLGLSLPTEPLIIIVLFIFIYQFIAKKDFLQYDFLKHPFSIVIYLSLLWMFFTSITSQIPLVSFKYLTSRIWFIVAFYFVASVVFFQNKANIKTFIWSYVFGFIPIITYTIIHHSLYNFRQIEGHWVMHPFFNDHTSYAAMIAMFTPFIFGSIFDKELSPLKRRFVFVLFIYFLFAVALSYTRAAWLSLVVAFGVFLLVYYKVKMRVIFVLFLTVLGIFISTKDQVMMYVEKNNNRSSSNYLEHIKSAYNVTTDVSNTERINRWQCAFRMFHEKPFLGYGPGTYQFEYAPFQKKYEKTIISTNAGTKGNAHSEYIGPLAESGVLGSLLVIILLFLVIYKGIKVYHATENKTSKIVVISALLGLITYFTHGTLNNFLDTDKASAPFWGFIAIIAVIDIENKLKISKQNSPLDNE